MDEEKEIRILTNAERISFVWDLDPFYCKLALLSIVLGSHLDVSLLKIRRFLEESRAQLSKEGG